MNRTPNAWRTTARLAPAWRARARLAVVRIARQVAATLVEMHRAQRRLDQLRFAPDRYAINPDVPPEHYAEFLYRTSGPLLHEPAARRRADP